MKTTIRKNSRYLLLAVFAMLLCMMAGSKVTYAANNWSVKVDSGYLALRTQKAFNASNEIGKLYTGDIVDVTDASDGTYWYVYSDKLGKFGYVNKNYLVQTQQSAQPAGSSDVYKVVNLKSGYLALRTQKVYDNNNIIGKLYNEDSVIVLDQSDANYWYVYSGKLDQYGYVNKDYLAVTVQTDNTYVVSNLLSGYLALRNAKAFDYNNEIGKLYNGDTVTVADSSDGKYWYVYSGKLGKYGYVNKDYLTSSNPQPTANSYVVTDLASGYLALRTAKVYDYSNEIGKLYNGDVVEVSDTSDATYWYVYSSKLGLGGYVNKKYLKAAQNTAPSSNTWYEITSDYYEGISLRIAPDQVSAVLTRLPKGAIFCVTAYNGNYGYTNYNGCAGWVNLNYAAIRN